MPIPGTSTPEYPWGKPIKWPNPIKAWRERRELAAFIDHQKAQIGTGLDAVNYALDMDDRAEIALFLEDWRAGDLGSWPDYRPAPALRPALTGHGLLLRGSALLAGFFAALMIFADLAELVTRGGGDPVRVLLTCTWGAAVLICAGAAWRAALQRGEG